MQKAAETINFILTEEDINEIVKEKSELLTPEVCTEKLVDILEVSTGFTEMSMVDKLTWVVRWSYLCGFKDALDIYPQALVIKEDERRGACDG